MPQQQLLSVAWEGDRLRLAITSPSLAPLRLQASVDGGTAAVAFIGKLAEDATRSPAPVWADALRDVVVAQDALRSLPGDGTPADQFARHMATEAHDDARRTLVGLTLDHVAGAVRARQDEIGRETAALEQAVVDAVTPLLLRLFTRHAEFCALQRALQSGNAVCQVLKMAGFTIAPETSVNG